jgi:tripeptidyl-peptidase-1
VYIYSPSFSGLASLLIDHAIKTTGKPLGFMNPLLYTMQAQFPATFNDITIGNNKCTEDGCGVFKNQCQGFLATAGWDPVSGLGTPNYPAMIKAMNTLLLKPDVTA